MNISTSIQFFKRDLSSTTLKENNSILLIFK
jgi:hypothetical protein